MSWNAPIELSVAEAALVKVCKKQKLWGFLREFRHLIIDDEVREKLRLMYKKGGKPQAPERLLLALILQVAFDVADHEVPTLTYVDKRWQMVLDCLGSTSPVFSQGTVFHFRERARAHGLMSYVLNKTVDIARETGGYGHKNLRALIDSSPLVGAGRVEDTFNLLGRAIANLVDTAAKEAGVEADELAEELGVTVFSSTSIKAVLDVDWRLPSARKDALTALMEQFSSLQKWLSSTFDVEKIEGEPIKSNLELVQNIITQDLEPDPEDPTSHRLIEGTKSDRIVSLTDSEMRHGRKSKTKSFAGYKRHIVVDGDVAGLICAVDIQAANQRDHMAVSPLLNAVADAGFTVTELHVDRGYLPAPKVVQLHEKGCDVVTKPPFTKNKGLFTKADFDLDFRKAKITCPNDVVIPLRLGKQNTFPLRSCRVCPKKDQCTVARQRTINVHHQEEWYRKMASELATKNGRARRRARVPVEHSLARVSSIQGNRARFRGLKKNKFNLECVAVVSNLFTINRTKAAAA